MGIKEYVKFLHIVTDCTFESSCLLIFVSIGCVLSRLYQIFVILVQNYHGKRNQLHAGSCIYKGESKKIIGVSKHS